MSDPFPIPPGSRWNMRLAATVRRRSAFGSVVCASVSSAAVSWAFYCELSRSIPGWYEDIAVSGATRAVLVFGSMGLLFSLVCKPRSSRQRLIVVAAGICNLLALLALIAAQPFYRS